MVIIKILLSIIVVILTLIASILWFISDTLWQILHAVITNADTFSIISFVISLSVTVLFSIVAIVLSRKANRLSKDSEKLILAIQQLEYDSKIAMMAGYLYGTDYLPRIKEDLEATMNLKDSVTPDKQKRLAWYINKILKKPTYATPDRKDKRAMREIISLAEKLIMSDKVRRDFRKHKKRATSATST